MYRVTIYGYNDSRLFQRYANETKTAAEIKAKKVSVDDGVLMIWPADEGHPMVLVNLRHVDFVEILKDC